MFQTIRKGTLVAALAAATWGGVSVLAAPKSNSDNPSGSSYRPDQIIIIKEKGKPDRKCLIVSTTTQKDGVLCYKAKALDNGEIVTIYDRRRLEPPAVVPPPTPVKSTPTVTVTLPSDPTLKVAQPVAKPAPEKLTATASEASKTPPPKPPSKSLWTRIFGPSTSTSTSTTCSKTPAASCKVCQNGNPVPLIKPKPTITMAVEPPLVLPPTSVSILPPAAGSAVVPPSSPYGSAVVPPSASEKTTSIPPAPLLPNLGLQGSPPPMVAATPLPKYGQYPEQNVDDEKIIKCKITLKGAIRPSEREMAAEELIDSYKGNTPEIRTLLLVCAQKDPAPTVRLTCLRCLSKQGIKDEALMTALSAAQKDQDGRVREEAALSLARLSKKK